MDKPKIVLAGGRMAGRAQVIARLEHLQMLEALSMRVKGCTFEEAPTDWQRTIEDMVKRGVTFNIEVAE